MASALPQLYDAKTSCNRMIVELTEQMDNFTARLSALSRISPLVQDIGHCVIDVTDIHGNDQLVIDGLPYRVEVVGVIHEVLQIEVPGERQVVLTDFNCVERRVIGQINIDDEELPVTEPNTAIACYTCGTHGDNGAVARGWVQLNEAPGGWQQSTRVAFIGIETANRLADVFWPPGVRGMVRYDNMLTELLILQNSLYRLHRQSITVDNEADRELLKSRVGLMRARLASLEMRATDLLAKAIRAYNIFVHAMVIHEVLPQVPPPPVGPGLPLIPQPFQVDFAEAEAQALQMAEQVPNQPTLQPIIAGLAQRLTTSLQQIQEMAANFHGIPHEPMFIDLNIIGQQTVFIDLMVTVDFVVQGNGGHRDVFNANGEHLFNCTYQDTIQRWLVFSPNDQYFRSAGPLVDREGGQSMSVRVGAQQRVYMMRTNAAQQMNTSLNDGNVMKALRDRRTQALAFGHHFFLAVEAMDRAMRGPLQPNLPQPLDIGECLQLLDACRKQYYLLLRRMQNLYESVSMVEDCYECAVHLPAGWPVQQ